MEKSILWYGPNYVHELDSESVGDIWHHMTRWERRVAARREELEIARTQRDGFQPLEFEKTKVPLIIRIKGSNST
ncbi:hypothetical protein TWF730_000053 [Orbilia blumenaviensis]|uniref:Uncharacterized protein n=1 Tax=Orbilia blumenaviensis TaxID=1796055 RepID=A0AAV9VKD9_9PEZI